MESRNQPSSLGLEIKICLHLWKGFHYKYGTKNQVDDLNPVLGEENYHDNYNELVVNLAQVQTTTVTSEFDLLFIQRRIGF
jgi:hypothetical protein